MSVTDALSSSEHKVNIQKKNLNYCMPLTDRLGHLVEELYLLRNIFPPEEYNYQIYVAPSSKRKTANSVIFDLVTRGAKVIEVDDPALISLAYDSGEDVGLIEEGNDLWVLWGAETLVREFLTRVVLKGKSLKYQETLPLSYQIEGARLRDAFGIPKDAKIITLHAREAGWVPHLSYHSYRDADIENYLLATEYLISQGYYVIRLGDSSMKPISGFHPHLIDAPHHASYCPLVDPYFISVSDFTIASVSGPYHISRVFHKPTIAANATLEYNMMGHDNDLFLPKQYFSRQLGRPLTYTEVMLSPACQFYFTEEFEKSEITLLQNTPEEILSAVMEMEQRLSCQYAKQENLKITTDILKVQKNIHAIRKHIFPEPNNFLAMPFSKMTISHEYIKMNPWFLGHRFE